MGPLLVQGLGMQICLPCSVGLLCLQGFLGLGSGFSFCSCSSLPPWVPRAPKRWRPESIGGAKGPTAARRKTDREDDSGCKGFALECFYELVPDRGRS